MEVDTQFTGDRKPIALASGASEHSTGGPARRGLRRWER